MPKCGEIIKNMLLGLAGTVVMICLAVSLTVWFRPLYYFDIDYLDIPQSSGVSAELCRLNYDALIDYNVPGGSTKLMFPTMPMSESGRKHFEEVKDIFLAMQWVAVLGLAVFGIYLLRDAVRTGKMREAAAFHAAHTLRLRYRWMLWAVWLAAGIGGIVLLAVIIDWENAFTLMHKIFFDNDDWLFNPQTDPIITMLPDTFFMHCGFLTIGLTILFCAGLQHRNKLRCSGILRDNKTYMKKADTQVSNLSTGYQPFYYEGNITVRCFRNIDKSTFRSNVHSCSTALCAGAKRIPRKIHHHTFKSS